MAAPMYSETEKDDESHSNCTDIDWFQNHPKLIEMRSWGYSDQSKIMTALIVYLDLCEAKTWWNVALHRCDALQMAFITGRAEKKADFQTVLPISMQENLSVERLEEFLDKIPLPPQREGKASETSEADISNTINLAIVDTDSTIVFYTIANGLQQPKNVSLDGAEDADHPTPHKNKPKKKGRWKKKKKPNS